MTDPAVATLQGEDAGSVLGATVVAHDSDDEITRLEFPGGELHVAGLVGQVGHPLRVRIRAADVSLCRDLPARSSILNILPATVRRIVDGAGGIAYALLTVGDDEIMARITRRSARDLELREGEQLYAQIKSSPAGQPPASD